MGRQGTLRVIAGSAGGLRLAYPKDVEIRPTADRVREAIFNILGDRVADARVLDLFAGTGAFGVEALSRGAAWCLFVERHRGCIAAINDNLRKTNLSDRAEVVCANAFKFPGTREMPLPFDIIFLDPPYRFSQNCEPGSEIAGLLERLGSPDVLAAGGLTVVEHASNAIVPEQLPGLVLLDGRRYGSTGVSFFRRA